jgi:hypothetical protein
VDSVQKKMAELREGKSSVKEWNHTLLIGWTDRSIAFIEQICIANESSGGGVIVVLAEPSKEAMEAELRSSVIIVHIFERRAEEGILGVVGVSTTADYCSNGKSFSFLFLGVCNADGRGRFTGHGSGFSLGVRPKSYGLEARSGGNRAQHRDHGHGPFL